MSGALWPVVGSDLVTGAVAKLVAQGTTTPCEALRRLLDRAQRPADARERSERTTVVTRSIAKSMSASVVARPRPKRIEAPARSPVAPMACEHVRRGLAAGAAGGAGRDGEIAERHQQVFAVDVREADVQVVRQADVRERAVDADAVEVRAASAASRRSRIAARRAPSSAITVRQISARGRDRRCPGTLSVPERRPFSCPPPSIWQASSQPRLPPPHVQRARPLRAVELVRR